MTILASKPLVDAIIRYQAGDSAAFDIIYYESIHYVSKCVLNVLNRTAPNATEDLLQDILQETYLTIASNLHTLRSPDAFLQWAGQIATHYSQRTWNKDLHRQQMEQPEDDLVYELMDERFIPEDILANKEKQQLIRKMLTELPTNQYLCVVEYFYNGLKETEVAAKLGMPLNTVKTNLSRAKKKLKAIVEGHEQRSGVKLYSMSWLLLGFFYLELRTFFLDKRVQDNVLRILHKGMGVYSVNPASGSSSSASSSKSFSASANGSFKAAGTAASAGAMGLLHTAAAKICAVVLAAAVTCAGALGLHQHLQKSQTPSDVTQTTEDTTPVITTEAPPIIEPAPIENGLLHLSLPEGSTDGQYTVMLVNPETQELYTEPHCGGTFEMSFSPGKYILTVEAEGYDPYTVQIMVSSEEITAIQCPALSPSLQLYTKEELSAIQKLIGILGIPSGGDSSVLWNAQSSGADTQSFMWLTLKEAMWYQGGIETQSVKGDNEKITAFCVDAERFLTDLFGQYPQDLYSAVRKEYNFIANDGNQLTLWYPPSLGSIGATILQIQQVTPDTIQVLAQLRSTTYGTGSAPTIDCTYGDYVVVTLKRSDADIGWTCLEAARFPAYTTDTAPDTAEGLMSVSYTDSLSDIARVGKVIHLDTDESYALGLFPAAPVEEPPASTEETTNEYFEDDLPYMPKAIIDASIAYEEAIIYLKIMHDVKTVVTETTPLLYIGEDVDQYGYTYYIFDWCNYNAETGEYTVIDTVKISSYGGTPIS